MHIVLYRRITLSRPAALATRWAARNRRGIGTAQASPGPGHLSPPHPPQLGSDLLPNIHEPIDLNFDMPPDYELESFWENRFKTESHFEWLGDGGDTIIPVLRQFLEARLHNQSMGIPRVLHIGAGTSTLSDGIVQLYRELFENQGGAGRGVRGPGAIVLNTDFAESAVTRGKQSKSATEGEVEWERVDLLQWRDVETLRRKLEPDMDAGGQFDFVVDKSTSDAISCGAGVSFEKNSPSTPRGPKSALDVHPLISSSVPKTSRGILTLDPLEVLAVHLASLVRPGGLWVALSYSSGRFPFLVSPGERRLGAQDLVDVTRYWSVEAVREVDTPEGWGKKGIAFAPDIKHYMYIFRRTDIAPDR